MHFAELNLDQILKDKHQVTTTITTAEPIANKGQGGVKAKRLTK